MFIHNIVIHVQKLFWIILIWRNWKKNSVYATCINSQLIESFIVQFPRRLCWRTAVDFQSHIRVDVPLKRIKSKALGYDGCFQRVWYHGVCVRISWENLQNIWRKKSQPTLSSIHLSITCLLTTFAHLFKNITFKASV